MPIATDREGTARRPFPSRLFPSSGYFGREAAEVPEEFVRCREHVTEQPEPARATAAAWQLE